MMLEPLSQSILNLLQNFVVTLTVCYKIRQNTFLRDSLFSYICYLKAFSNYNLHTKFIFFKKNMWWYCKTLLFCTEMYVHDHESNNVQIVSASDNLYKLLHLFTSYFLYC